jgi:TFIIH basal transcription factor complex TTD-A subunit
MMPVAHLAPGVLIECDPSIHSIISKFDAENHDYIIEDLDETHVVVKENMLPLLKKKLDDVPYPTWFLHFTLLTFPCSF